MLSVFVWGCQINQSQTLNTALKSHVDTVDKEYKWWLFMLIWHVQMGVLICRVLVSYSFVLDLLCLFTVIVTETLLVSLCCVFFLQGCRSNWSLINDIEHTWARCAPRIYKPKQLLVLGQVSSPSFLCLHTHAAHFLSSTQCATTFTDSSHLFIFLFWLFLQRNYFIV